MIEVWYERMRERERALELKLESERRSSHYRIMCGC